MVRIHAFTTVAWVQSLVGELMSPKLHCITKLKKKNLNK